MSRNQLNELEKKAQIPLWWAIPATLLLIGAGIIEYVTKPFRNQYQIPRHYESGRDDSRYHDGF